MKKIPLSLLCLFFWMVINGQITQKGIVKVYNSQGKTLSGVGIVIPSASDYQPVVSNADGTFQLHFSHHRSGDLIYNIKITKEDYEIVNIYDFKDGWTLSVQDTMTIIVAHRGVIAEKRAHYYNVMDKYTEAAYKKKIQHLTQELDNQSISAEEYRQKALAAEEELKQAYEKIDAYADLFARINDDELDSISSQAILYLQQGNIDQAIWLFEEQHLVDQLNKKVALRNQSEEAIQLLIPKLHEEIAFRNVAGGVQNLNQIDRIHNSIIAADPEKIQYQKDYIQFLIEQNKLNKAKALGEKAFSLAQTPLERTMILQELGMIQYHLNHYPAAIEHLKQAYSEAAKMRENDLHAYLLQQTGILNTMANVFIDNQQYSKAQECLDESSILGRQLIQLDSSSIHTYATNLSNISELYRSISILNRDSTTIQQALTYNRAAINQLTSIANVSSPDYQYHLIIKYNNRGSIFIEARNLDSALYYLKKSDTLWGVLYDKNPSKYVVNWCQTLSNLALTYSRLEQYEEAHAIYNKAYSLYQSSISTQPLKAVYISMLTSEGVLLRKEKRYEEAKQNNLAALQLQNELSQEEGKRYAQQKEFIYNNLATVSFFAKQLDSALYYYKLQREEIKGLMQEEPNYGNYSLSECTYYIAYCYYHLQDAKHGIPEYRKARRFFVQFNKEKPGRYDKLLADIDKEMRELRSRHK